MKNSIVDLRNHLFEVIERLKDPDPKTPMDCETAEAICLAAKRLIETAEVEVKFRTMLGKQQEASDFLGLSEARNLKQIGTAQGKSSVTGESK